MQGLHLMHRTLRRPIWYRRHLPAEKIRPKEIRLKSGGGSPAVSWRRPTQRAFHDWGDRARSAGGAEAGKNGPPNIGRRIARDGRFEAVRATERLLIRPRSGDKAPSR